MLPIATLLFCLPVALPAQVATSHVMAAPWGQLVTSTESSFGVASLALAQSARRFERLFGDRPPAIGLVVDDTSAGAAAGSAVSPASGPLVLITGAIRNDGQGRAELDTMVRFMAASTWIERYTAHWRESVMDLVPASGPSVPEHAELPDWLRVAAVTLVADGVEASDAYMRAHLHTATPLRELFRFRLGSDDAASMESAQAASVLDYIRLMEGSEATRDLFGMLAMGTEIEVALHAMPRPATIESLDAAWRRWLSAMPTDAILPRNGVR